MLFAFQFYQSGYPELRVLEVWDTSMDSDRMMFCGSCSKAVQLRPRTAVVATTSMVCSATSAKESAPSCECLARGANRKGLELLSGNLIRRANSSTVL